MNKINFDEKLTVALDEAQSREVLETFGIPTVASIQAFDKEEAIAAAHKTGFPLVLKGLGRTLLHKTEMGIVHVKITDIQSFNAALEDIEKKAGADLEGYLIQKYVSGQREWAAGMFRDQLFGPIVMFGVGGIYTETLQDVSFRTVPLSTVDCEDMLLELRARKLLEGVRGQKPVDKGQIIKILKALSRIAEECPDISEIDINPLIADKSGGVLAVDALVIKGTSDAKDTGQHRGYHDLTLVFRPKSIAFVGASAQIGKWGNILPSILLGGGFDGGVYLVNPKGGELAGRKFYNSVLDIPDDIDLAVVTVPAKNVTGLIPDFRNKGIRNMMVITSGFSETDEAGKKMERELLRAAQDNGITLIGPNLMGICNPSEKMNITIFGETPEAGNVGVISQSGNMAVHLMSVLKNHHIGISSLCANGNEAMVNTEDFLEYYSNDEKTSVVTAYLERISGKSFFAQCRRLTQNKPFIVLKGGRGETGKKAAASHTGGMTTDVRLFDAACRQTGVIRVENVMELTDLSAAFSYLPLPRGNRIAIITMGGGFGVIAADHCEKHGLAIPELPPELIAEFNNYFPPFWSHANPVDMVNDKDKTLPFKVMESMAKWDGCDLIIHIGLFGQGDLQKSLARAIKAAQHEQTDGLIEELMAKGDILDNMVFDYPISFMKKYGKPILGVGSWFCDDTANIVYKKDTSGLASLLYITPERAVFAAAKLCEYAAYKNKRQ